jgi:hypothetical protein
MTTRTPDTHLTHADAWLLHAILVAGEGGPARLFDVLQAGDMINHAIFTLAELDGGVTRLMWAGVVSSAGKEFVPSRQMAAFYASLRGRSMHEAGEQIRQRIGAADPQRSYDPNTCDPVWRSGVVTDADLQLAYLAGAPQSHR